jgi:hypothetical protein
MTKARICTGLPAKRLRHKLIAPSAISSLQFIPFPFGGRRFDGHIQLLASGKIRITIASKTIVQQKQNDVMKNETPIENLNFKADLRNDDVYGRNQVTRLSTLTGMPVRRGLENVIVCEGEIVNVVSDSYAHLPNQKFFPEVEVKLIDEGIGYVTRSINRENRSYAVDYILSDDSLVVKVKNGLDKIRPMLRFINSYDGSSKTSGHFGFFREVCGNGLHVAQSKIGFSVKHRGNIAELVLPRIQELVSRFMDNEFYSIHKKFEVLAERPIPNLDEFVKVTADHFSLFQFECSKTNPSPSLNARLVLETLQKESILLREEPNMWHGYNAFNSVLHTKLKKTFQTQKNLDQKIFEYLLEQ